MQLLIAYTKLRVVNDMLRSFDLENKHENVMGKMLVHLITSFNQLHGDQGIISTYQQLVLGRDVIHNITFRETFNQLHNYQAIRSTYDTTLQATQCQLVFGRDK
jgi:hypothetical protein